MLQPLLLPLLLVLSLIINCASSHYLRADASGALPPPPRYTKHAVNHNDWYTARIPTRPPPLPFASTRPLTCLHAIFITVNIMSIAYILIFLVVVIICAYTFSLLPTATECYLVLCSTGTINNSRLTTYCSIVFIGLAPYSLLLTPSCYAYTWTHVLIRYSLLLATGYWLLATYYLLITTYHLLLTTCYLLLTTYYLLLTAYCLLLTTL